MLSNLKKAAWELSDFVIRLMVLFIALIVIWFFGFRK